MLFVYKLNLIRSFRGLWLIGLKFILEICMGKERFGCQIMRRLSTNRSGLVELYRRKVKNKELADDLHQVKALKQLERLHFDLLKYEKPPELSWKHRWGLEDVPEIPKGIYMHGGVGCGKTFLMDFFFENAPIDRKRRVHFHEWMLEVHDRLHRLKQSKIDTDILEYLTQQMLQQSWLICFDEFQVTDVADALLVRRLFTSMFQKGAVIVATSNRHPNDLYKNGLQRDLFLPFIHLLQDKCIVHSLLDSTTDYRALKAQQHADDAYLYPLNPTQRDIYESLFQMHVEGTKVKPMYLNTQGRSVYVPQASKQNKVAKFTFSDLCKNPLGAADYFCIAQAFPTVFVSDIPRLGLNDLNAVRRFITLIDCFYDHRIQLYCLADAPALELFHPGESVKKGSYDEVFFFDRTISRLHEVACVRFIKTFLHVSRCKVKPIGHNHLFRAIHYLLKMYWQVMEDKQVTRSTNVWFFRRSGPNTMRN